MLDSLRKIIDTGEFEDNGSLIIENPVFKQDDLLIRIWLTLPDGRTIRQRSVGQNKPAYSAGGEKSARMD